MELIICEISGGTSLMGYINTTYENLVRVFGEPGPGSGDNKTDVEWEGYIDGEPFNIYNWKDGKSYCGDEGLDVKDITEWNVGGKSRKALWNVEEMLEK